MNSIDRSVHSTCAILRDAFGVCLAIIFNIQYNLLRFDCTLRLAAAAVQSMCALLLVFGCISVVKCDLCLSWDQYPFGCTRWVHEFVAFCLLFVVLLRDKRLGYYWAWANWVLVYGVL